MATVVGESKWLGRRRTRARFFVGGARYESIWAFARLLAYQSRNRCKISLPPHPACSISVVRRRQGDGV